jgi:tripartite-type tricarboxylate transporter receptor subunit TctC
MWAKETYGEDVASRIKAIVGGTTDEKKQRLWDGNADIIYADVSSLVEYTKEGVDAQLATKIFDTCGKVEGYSSMADAGMTFSGDVFSFNKDFFMYFPKDMDEGILAEINEAMMKVAANPEFQAEMAAMKYTAVSPENTDMAVAREYINWKRTNAIGIVEQCPSLDELT